MFANSGDQLLSINDQFSLARDLIFKIKKIEKFLKCMDRKIRHL